MKYLCVFLLSISLSVSVFAATDSNLGYGEIQIGGDDSDGSDGYLLNDDLDMGGDSTDSIIIQDDVSDNEPDMGTGSAVIQDDPDVTTYPDASDPDDIIIEPISGGRSRELIKHRNAKVAEHQKALKKIWDLITKHADLDYYLKNGWSELMQSGDKQHLKLIASDVTAGCDSDYDKIKAIYDYVTDTIYYDWDYADRPNDYPNRTHMAYEVYQTKRAVCEGYASLSKVLCQLSGIPCISVRGMDHIYNAGYDSGHKRWVIFDTTYGSNNYLESAQFHEKASDPAYFDLSFEDLGGLLYHEVLYVDGLLSNNVNGGHYGFRSNQKDWSDTTQWYCVLEDGDSKKSVTAVDSIGGIPVLKVDDFAFDDDVLVSLDLSKSKIQEIGTGAFRNCKHLVELKTPETLSVIHDYAFFKNGELSGLDLAHTQVRSIGEYAFADCENLARVLFPETLESMGVRCFRGCQQLRIASVFQTKVKEIPVGCFRGCTTLRAFTGSDVLVNIQENAFTSCPHLHYMLLYNKNVDIADGALGGYVHIWYDDIK